MIRNLLKNHNLGSIATKAMRESLPAPSSLASAVKRCAFVVILAPTLLSFAFVTPAQAEDPNMTKGVDEYRSRDYETAAVDFGAALPYEYNNPYLHYYLANCMVHLRDKKSAIQEYRIAYALDPQGKIGKYCKMCLILFGIDAEGKVLPHKPAAKSPPPPVEAPSPEQPPSAAEIAALKAHPRDGSVCALERERSVKNLEDLMQQKPRPTGSPLPQQVGTNLYVRNYKQCPQSTGPLAQGAVPLAASAAATQQLPVAQRQADTHPSTSAHPTPLSAANAATPSNTASGKAKSKPFRLWWW